MKPKDGHPYYKLSGGMTPVTPAEHDLCVRRTMALLRDTARPLQDLLANAYFLGLKDAVDVTEGRS